METEATPSEAFPDLISAALHGAGISGDDLALDFNEENEEVDNSSLSFTQPSVAEQLTPMAPTVPTIMAPPNGVQGTPILQPVQNQRMAARVISPPHMRTQANIQNIAITPKPRMGTPTIRVRAMTPGQSMQAFRIVRTPSQIRGQQPVQVVSRSQPIPRHLIQSVPQPVSATAGPALHNTSVFVGTPQGLDNGPKRIIRIPSSSGNTLSHGQQVIIQSANGNSQGPSQVLKVTATSGKPVTTEDISKIVSSLPNLKSGSKIIVNPTSSGGADRKQTIQVLSKPPMVSVHQAVPPTTVLAQPILARPVQANADSLHNGLPIRTQSIPALPQPVAMSVNSRISCLPFSPINAGTSSKQLGQIGALSGVPVPPVGTIPTVAEKAANTGFKMSMSNKDLTKAWNDTGPLRRTHSAQSLRNFKTEVDEEEIEEEVEELGHAATYAEYKPSKLNFGKKHPDPVVETSSLSSVEPPDVKYQLRILDEGVDEDGCLSALQLECITYACQRHNTILPNGERAGYLIGDGAGVGKGRSIAGIIFENYLLRRKRALWLSVSNDLRVDAERDLRDIGAHHIEVYPLNKFKYYSKISSKENNSCKKGVIFATYSSLIGESQAEGKYNTRLKQLLKWLGHDFDGVIVFDECHKAKNLCPTGSSKPTKTGQTVLELQNRLSKARVIYASATGASEPKNMAYMTRLGLWGEGTPFREFNDFIQAVERRGVGAMELVAMDAKLRGMYIARQLSFHGVTFRIDEIPLEKDFKKVYNLAVEMWVEAREMFQQAAELVDAEHRMKKSMWGQFWSAHQRFFKYLCISAKVNHCVDLARDAVKCGKCVVIGLQSTGEARTMEQVEEVGGELTDFVSTAKGVFQSLVERHFPASTRGRALDIIKRVSNSHQNRNSPDPWKMKKELSEQNSNKRQKLGDDSSDPESNGSDSSDFDDIDLMSSDDSSSESNGEGHNPFANGWDSDEDDPWCQKKRKRKESPKKKKKVKKRKLGEKKKNEDEDDEDQYMDRALAKAGLLNKTMSSATDGPSGNWEKASAMKSELLSRIEFLGEKLPPNTLDQLIDEMGGPENVAEMTGRKSRVVSTSDGVQFESRSETDVPLEILNLTEKQRFMDGEKNVAIISEAASSGISLQADRRALNQKRRVHITLELPWSADRAIQQFGRTHRSNQVSAPEYVFLISELSGERRFAATVAKRLESLGALTHGDRRATESRDLSRFNIDNKYGRTALETVMKSVLGLQTDGTQVQPPVSYPGDFFKDVKDALIGVGMINVDEKTGYCTLEKDFNNISKFLNRILGMKVTVQNALFTYFTETLTAIVLEAKRNGRWDMGILDLGSGEEKVRKIETRVFVGNTATNTAKTELTKFAVERGMAWPAAAELWRRCNSTDEGFYCTHQDRLMRKTVILAVAHGKNKKREQLYNVYRANTGLQGRCETLEEIRKKYKKCLPDVAQPLWEEHYLCSEKECSHRFLRGNCRKASTGQLCEFGLRTRFYHVLSGSVLSVWSKVEAVLAGMHVASRMQIIRLRMEDNQRIVGSLIPANAVLALERVLSMDSARSYTEKHDNPFIPHSSTPSHRSTGSARDNHGSRDGLLDGASDLNSVPEEKETVELLSMPTLVW